jgi:hypothetical protein
MKSRKVQNEGYQGERNKEGEGKKKRNKGKLGRNVPVVCICVRQCVFYCT